MHSFILKNLRTLGVLTIACAVICCVKIATCQTAQHDSASVGSFDPGKLPNLHGGWTFVHDDKGTIAAKEGEFAISPARDTNLFLSPDGGFNVVNAPMALFAPAGDFTLTAKVSARLVDAYDVAAMVVWEDEKHWAKLCFENSAMREATIVTVVTRERSDDANSETIASPFAYIAIARKGNEFSMHFSRDGVQWRLARHFQMPASDNLRVGFTAHTFSNQHFAAVFSDVVYRPTPPKNLRQLDPADFLK